MTCTTCPLTFQNLLFSALSMCWGVQGLARQSGNEQEGREDSARELQQTQTNWLSLHLRILEALLFSVQRLNRSLLTVTWLRGLKINTGLPLKGELCPRFPGVGTHRTV